MERGADFNVINVDNRIVLDIVTMRMKREVVVYLDRKIINKLERGMFIYMYEKVCYRKCFVIDLKLMVKELLWFFLRSLY